MTIFQNVLVYEWCISSLPMMQPEK